MIFETLLWMLMGAVVASVAYCSVCSAEKQIARNRRQRAAGTIPILEPAGGDEPARKFCARITRPDGTVHSLVYFDANTRPRIVTIHGVLLIPPGYCQGKDVHAPVGWQLELLEINK